MGNPNENIEVAKRWFEENAPSKRDGCLPFILLLGLVVAAVVAFAILCGVS